MPTNLTCIAIDDDPIFLRKMDMIIDDISWLELAGTYNNPIQGATALISKKPDLLFLDMEMPHTGGGYLMDWLSPKIETLDPKPKVIIITSLEKESTDNLPNVSGYINKSKLDQDSLIAEIKRLTD